MSAAPRSGSSARTSSQDVTADAPALTPRPTSTRRYPSIPPRHASAHTSAVASSPPVTATIGRPAETRKPPTIPAPEPARTIAATAAAVAPAVTPRMSGLASGLRATDCVMAPAAPSAKPTTSAVTARGARSPSTTNRSAGSPVPSRVRITSPAGSTYSPTMIEATSSASTSPTRPADTRTWRRVPGWRRRGAKARPSRPVCEARPVNRERPSELSEPGRWMPRCSSDNSSVGGCVVVMSGLPGSHEQGRRTTAPRSTR